MIQAVEKQNRPHPATAPKKKPCCVQASCSSFAAFLGSLCRSMTGIGSAVLEESIDDFNASHNDRGS